MHQNDLVKPLKDISKLTILSAEKII